MNQGGEFKCVVSHRACVDCGAGDRGACPVSLWRFFYPVFVWFSKLLFLLAEEDSDVESIEKAYDNN